MLVAIDVGNTHVVLGLYDGGQLKASWRLQSDRNRTVDEYALEIMALLANASVKIRNIKRVVLCCVVPSLTRVFAKMSQKYFEQEPLIVGPETKTGMKIVYDDVRAVGADRIVNALAGKALFGAPLIVVDFGTATTFDVVGTSGDYEGGIISPGILISAEALFERAAMLPKIELTTPDVLIGKNTRDSMLSGIVYGYVALLEGLVARLKKDLGGNVMVIATGGLARVLAQETKVIDRVVPDLTLQGLKLIAEMNP